VGGLVPASWVRIPPSPLISTQGTSPGASELSAAVLRRARAAGAAPDPELESLVARLQEVDPTLIEGDAARIAFWINLYNARLLHRLARRPVSGSMALRPRLFSATSYRVGERTYTLDEIEHGILRRNRRPPYRPRRPFRRSDPRLAAAPSRLDPRIHFALNCGARSCPPVTEYGPDSLQRELEAATRAYLEAETTIDPEAGRVELPRLMRLYRGDFGGREEQLEFAAARLPRLAQLRSGPAGLKVGYGRFDWRAERPAGAS
jgi:hypothetical protein